MDVALAHYALYRINTEKLSDADFNRDNSCPEWETAGVQNICSSLSPHQENLLRLFLVRRLRKGAIYISTGAFSGMEFSLGGNSPAVCYYVLLPSQALVCLLAIAEANLEVFRPELAQFCEDLEPYVKDADVNKRLAVWHTQCVQYIPHVLDALGAQVGGIFQLVQCNGGIKVESGVPSALESDVRQFLAACSVTECLMGPSPGVDAILRADLLSPHKLYLDGVEANTYCMEWGKLLLDLGPSAEPWRLRKQLEAFKLKTIKDMNILKRLLKQAETDHYFLYRAYSFLWQTGNSDILLRQAALEGSSSSDVLSVLQHRLANSSPTPVTTRV